MKINITKFTLIEVLVASLLMTMMITGLVIVSSNLNSSWLRSSNVNRQFYELVNIERVLDNSMPNAIPFVWRNQEEFKERVSTFTGEPDKIAFCYLHRLNNLEEGAIRFMGLIQEDDELVAYYKNRPWINFDELNDESITRTVIAEGIESVSFQYALSVFDAGEETYDWLDEWDDEDETRFDIPLAFRIDIDFGEDIVETFLYRTAGNSRFQRWGDWKPDKSAVGSSGSGSDSGDEDTGEPPAGPGIPGKPGTCFTADNIIQTPSGLKSISNFMIGDPVYGIDHDSEELYVDTVRKIDIHEVKNVEIFNIQTPCEVITATYGHKFITPTGYTLSENIKSGDTLHTLDGAEVKVIKVIKETFSGKVYNLRLKKGNKYSIGTGGVVVYDF